MIDKGEILKTSVLDNGYVRLVDHLGNDLTVVNTARVSFDKESYFLSEKDQRLINYLVKHKHDSCFRHCVMTFEVYAPLMVGRQWWKHGLASSHVEDQHGWNESCLPAWQEVWPYGAQRYTVQDIIDGNRIPLRSFNGTDIVPNIVKHVWPAGEAEVFTVTDEFGNRVSATGNHRILTPDGYTELQYLSIGNKIAHNGKHQTVFGYGVIVSIESAGVHPVYDIEMELEENFVAGGVVVHNSRRYVTENEEFYVPAQFLGAPANKKQGAGDPISDNTNLTFKTLLADHQQNGLELYNQAMEAGIAPEQARLFLPAYGLYIRWRWTVSLNALMHFLDQRLDNHAQFEIRQYAKAIEPMVKEQYPMVYAAWVESRR